LLVGVATFDAATDDLLTFEIVKLDGPRPAACDAIASAMS
jgi:hypothetical protein